MNISDLKNVITQDQDSFRTMYSQCFDNHPRAAGLFGTTNKHYLRLDKTGNRRFWIVPITSCDATPFVNSDYQQVWAELLHHANELSIDDWNTSGQEKEKIDMINNKFMKQTTANKSLDIIFTDYDGESTVYDSSELDFNLLFEDFPQRLQRLFTANNMFFPVRGNKAYIHLSKAMLMHDFIDVKLSSFNYEIEAYIDHITGWQNQTKIFSKLVYKQGVVYYHTGKSKPTPYHFLPYKQQIKDLIAQDELPGQILI